MATVADDLHSRDSRPTIMPSARAADPSSIYRTESPKRRSASTPTGTRPGAALPPMLSNALNRKNNVTSVLKELNRTPLFMTELDESDGEGGENMELEAIKALQHEGTRSEVARNFREQGNESARSGNWKDAKEYYTQALDVLSQPRKQHESEDGAELGLQLDDNETEDEIEKVKEKVIEEACYVNRALCNFELKNYGMCNKDCAGALRLNPNNIKAYYRVGLACLALDKLPSASDACEHALALDPHNEAAHVLHNKIQKRKVQLAKKNRDTFEAWQRRQAEEATLKKALSSRGIVNKRTKAGTPADMDDASIELADPMHEDSALSLPTVLLYPTASESDIIKSFAESETLTQHLEYILPPPWDEDHVIHTPLDVECFMDTAAGGLVKVGKHMEIGQVLKGGKVVLKDGMCFVYVVPKGEVDKFIEDMKKRKGKEMAEEDP